MAISKDTNKSGSSVGHGKDSLKGRRSMVSVAKKVTRIDDRSVSSITADEAHTNRSAVARINASLVDARQSVLGSVQTNEVWVRGGAVGAVRAKNADIAGFGGLIVGSTVRIGKASAAFVAGREIHADKIESLVVFGDRVEGEVNTLFNARQAVIAGLLGGLLAGLILSLTRVLIRHD